MAIVYTKQDQGLTITVGNGVPVHSAVNGDKYTDLTTGKLYAYQNNWALVGSSYVRRHETTSNYDYLGYAIEGTLESNPTWNLTRLTLSSSGISAVMTATDSWNNRVTATYI